jgi:hypothetical protein
MGKAKDSLPGEPEHRKCSVAKDLRVVLGLTELSWLLACSWYTVHNAAKVSVRKILSETDSGTLLIFPFGWR